MDLTIAEVLRKHNINLGAAWPETQAAFDEYAAQEAKSYASWLGNQVIAGRTAHKLWLDYTAQILNQRPALAAPPAPTPALLEPLRELAGCLPCFVRPAGDYNGWCLVSENDRAQDSEREAMDFASFPDESTARAVAAILNAATARPTAPAATAEAWVSVGDALPEANGYYLVFGNCTGSGLQQDIATYSADEQSFHKFNQPTHWRRLPTPPTK